MSVSFSPASHTANSFNISASPAGSNRLQAASILQGSAPVQFKKCDAMLQSSFDISGPAVPNVIPKKNGFVDTVISCYNNHYALVIRPDDVWLSILTQFNFFVNGNAERMRDMFVSHEGKKELEIVWDGPGAPDFGHMSRAMTKLMEDNILDKDIRDWIIPDFSTTTVIDATVASITMMATMKEYFSYTFNLRCGIPRVTLEGTQEDWAKILAKLEKLKQYGVQTIAWYHLLHPIISMFVSAYDHPNDQANLDLWQKVCRETGGGSGPTFLSGWITAFCVFNEQGKWMGQPFKDKPSSSANPTTLSAADFYEANINPYRTYLSIAGAHYPKIDLSKIPCGFAEVDVKLIDASGKTFKTMMVAGSVASLISSSEDTKLSTTGKDDTAGPVVGWWMFLLADQNGKDAGDTVSAT